MNKHLKGGKGMFQFLAPHLREILERSSPSDWEEVRLRVNQPLVVKGRTGYCFLSPLGRVVPKDKRIVPPEDLARTVQILTNSSWYAWEDRLSGLPYDRLTEWVSAGERWNGES